MNRRFVYRIFFGGFLLAGVMLPAAAAQNAPAVNTEEARQKFEDVKDRLQNSEQPVKAEEAAAEKGSAADLAREYGIQFGAALLRVLVIIIFGRILYSLLKLGIRKIDEKITRKDVLRESDAVLRIRTLSGLAYWLGTIFIVGTVIYMALGAFGINVAPILAGAGIVGLAFGFGGQYLIRDIINGTFILLEGQFHVNDVIKVGDLGGLVEKVNLRVTQLRDLEGRVIFIPNGEIKTVINFTKEWSRALFDIGVAYKEDVDRVIQVIKDMGAEMRKDPYFGRLILEDLEMLGVDAFADSQITIRFFIKTLPIKQWEVAREFRRRLKRRFDELGIEIPFPHRTLYWGAGSDNDWMKQFFSKSPDAPGPAPARPE